LKLPPHTMFPSQWILVFLDFRAKVGWSNNKITAKKTVQKKLPKSAFSSIILKIWNINSKID
jgi:hypothetical protein